MGKIGILTLPFGPNYGMNLQVYALQTVLEKMGFEVTVINRKWNRIKQNSTILASIQRFFYYNILVRNIYSFYKSKIRLSVPCYTSEEIASVCKENNIDTIVIGSDQVWRIEHTRGANLDFFGGFISNESKIRVLSYAASFGNNNWRGTAEETKKISRLLSNFAAVSVRETSGLKMCKDLFGIEAVCSIDPTLLLSRSDYAEIMGEWNHKSGGIVTYILDKNSVIRDFIFNVSSQKNVPNIVDLYPKKKSRYRTYPYNIAEWLNYIMHADYVITDSFHGMVFSIIFKKQFYVIANRKRGVERFLSLLSELDMSDRLLYEERLTQSIELEEIDYGNVFRNLDRLKCLGLDYLQNNIRK